MTTPYASQEIRDAYGLFYRKKSGKRLPASLKGISFSNSTTFSTRVRLRLLKELCRRHQAANPNLSCFVTGYLARPELKIRDRRGMVTSLTYTKAIQQLPHHLTLSFLQELFHYAKTNLPEKEIIERFLILTPDLLLGSAPDQQPMHVDSQGPSQQDASAEAGVEILPTTPQVSLATGGLPLSQVTYASLAALPPSTSVGSFPPNQTPVSTPTPLGQTALFHSQLATPVTTFPASTVLTNTSPTYATLTTVQFSPPNPLSGSFLSTLPSSGLEAATGDDPGLVQRNRHRFASKSTPYPPVS
jgi:hypothetical protein